MKKRRNHDTRILSDWLCIEYCWCSVDMRKFCAARNSVISPLPSNSASVAACFRLDVCLVGGSHQVMSCRAANQNSCL